MRRWVAALVVAAAACADPPAAALPDAATIAAYYSYHGTLEVRLNGSFAEITVSQPAEQLRRGGALWARVGPYVVLFSEPTRRLFEEHPALAGVWVVTRVEDGTEVGRARLTRGELNSVLWRRALNIAGRARLEGTDKPGLLENLVEWGDDHAMHEYNPTYVPPR